MGQHTRYIVRASEIGQYVYCARAWWLGSVLGYESANVQAMESGLAAHRVHGQAVEAYQRRRRLASALLALAFLVAIALIIAVIRS